MRFRPWEGLTIKAALVLGFGTTVALWVLAGFELAERLRTVQAETATVNERYMRAQEVLSTVRAQILLGSVFVRDALLDPEPASVSGYRQNLEHAYNEADRALRGYVPVIGSESERARVAGLRAQIEAFRSASIEVLAGDRSQWPAEARLLLTRDIGPRRDSVVRVSDEIQAFNRATFVEQQEEVASLYAGKQRSVWQRLGLALAASLFIGVVAFN
jgi:hypothetical protein